MFFESLFDALNIIPMYNWIMFTLAVATVLALIASGQQDVLRTSKIQLPAALILCCLLCALFNVFIQYRVDVDRFGDLRLYYNEFEDIVNTTVQVDWEKEWGWKWFINICRLTGMDVWTWFYLVDFIIIGLMVLVSWQLMRGKEWIAVMFFFYLFIFSGTVANGIRNGFALSLLLICFAMLMKNKIWNAVAIVVMIASYSVHKSAILPIAAMFVSWQLNIKPKYAISFWLLAIPISLAFGSTISDFFINLGFDDRMESYMYGAEGEEVMEAFARTGFRWDFLLYSSMPVLFTWYLTMKRDFKDKTFNLIANTYILSNAFWIMVIRASYSNRFANLSWFLYPLVLAYPLLRFKIWDDQDRKVGYILLAHTMFSFTMNMIV